MRLSSHQLAERVPQVRHALLLLSDGEMHPRERLFPDAKKQGWPSLVLDYLRQLKIVSFHGGPTRHRKYAAILEAEEILAVDARQILLSAGGGVTRLADHGEDGDVPPIQGGEDEEGPGEEPDVMVLLAERLGDMTTAIVGLNERIFKLEESSRPSADRSEVIGYRVAINKMTASIAELRDHISFTLQKPPDPPPDPQTDFRDRVELNKSLSATEGKIGERLDKLEKRLLELDARADARDAQLAKRDAQLAKRDEDMAHTIANALLDLKDGLMGGLQRSISSLEEGTKLVVKEFVTANKRFIDGSTRRTDKTFDDLEKLVVALANEEATARAVFKDMVKAANKEGGSLKISPSPMSSILAITASQKGTPR